MTDQQRPTPSPAWLLSAEQAAAVDEHRIGGKAWNLAWLSRNSFPVPAWWVISTDGFQHQLAHAGLSDWVAARIADMDSADTQQVQAIANDIRSRLSQMSLAPSLYDALEQALAEQPDGTFAVRSSVVGEDSGGASFAGQMDSLLYQRGITAIADAVVQVMASAFNARALLYRVQKNLPLTDIRAAVIIQQMIDADAAGVMFTAHPANGSRRHALISGCWGCGEGVVSGLCSTDEFTVSLYDDDIEAAINDKDVCVVFDADTDRGTREVAVAEAQRQQPILSDQALLALRDLGYAIARARQAPQDIEWVWQDNRFHILQTRPITSLPAPSVASGDTVVWDNSNIQESYCGVTTPLTFSFAQRAYATVYEQTMRLIGVRERTLREHQPMLRNMLGLIRGRIYYNINNWYRGLLFLPSFSTNKADLERMMGLTDPVDMVEDKTLTLRQKLLRLPQLLRALARLLSGFARMDRLVAEFRQMFEQAYQSIDRGALHTLSIAELLNEARRLDRQLLDRWTTPIINDFYVMMMNGRLHRALLEAGISTPEAVQNNLLSGEEGIESTEPTKMLLEMADRVRADSALRRLIERSDNSRLLAMLQSAAPAFHQQCLDYIERYGDRTMGELKLESITLRQDSAFLFAVLKNFLRRDDLTRASLAHREAGLRAEAEANVLPAIRRSGGRRAERRFLRLLQRARAAIRNRENMRLARTRMFGLYRDIFVEIGTQMAFAGRLEQARDIFWLSVDELYAWQEGRAVQTQFQPLVSARRAEYAQYQDDDLPHHFFTHGVPDHHNEYVYPHEQVLPADGDDLAGTGCYPGIVEAEVRLIFSPQDELSLDGRILCTVRTDPGWAPLFPTASGIIVERGSTLSHSAVVARELGIPAIVGVANITRILSDGETLRMNGASGRIERLDHRAMPSAQAADDQGVA